MELDLCLLMEGFQLTIRYDQGVLSVGGFELISILPGIGVERGGDVGPHGPAPQASTVKRNLLREGEPVFT